MKKYTHLLWLVINSLRDDTNYKHAHSYLLIIMRSYFFIGGYREGFPAGSRYAGIESVASSVALTKSKLYQSRSSIVASGPKTTMIPK